MKNKIAQKIFKLFNLACAVVFLSSCGGGSGSKENSDLNDDTSKYEDDVSKNIGKINNPVVSGLSYRTSGGFLSRTTPEGKFYFNSGEKISFFIRFGSKDLIIGSVDSDRENTPFLNIISEEFNPIAAAQLIYSLNTSKSSSLVDIVGFELPENLYDSAVLSLISPLSADLHVSDIVSSAELDPEFSFQFSKGVSSAYAVDRLSRDHENISILYKLIENTDSQSVNLGLLNNKMAIGFGVRQEDNYFSNLYGFLKFSTSKCGTIFFESGLGPFKRYINNSDPKSIYGYNCSEGPTDPASGFNIFTNDTNRYAFQWNRIASDGGKINGIGFAQIMKDVKTADLKSTSGRQIRLSNKSCFDQFEIITIDPNFLVSSNCKESDFFGVLSDVNEENGFFRGFIKLTQKSGKFFYIGLLPKNGFECPSDTFKKDEEGCLVVMSEKQNASSISDFYEKYKAIKP